MGKQRWERCAIWFWLGFTFKMEFGKITTGLCLPPRSPFQTRCILINWCLRNLAGCLVIASQVNVYVGQKRPFWRIHPVSFPDVLTIKRPVMLRAGVKTGWGGGGGGDYIIPICFFLTRVTSFKRQKVQPRSKMSAPLKKESGLQQENIFICGLTSRQSNICWLSLLWNYP